MNNYPPGVSSNEYQIAGATDLVLSRDCEEDDCGWSGQVDGEYYDHEIWWICPHCGVEHSEQIIRDEDDYEVPYDPERWGSDYQW